MSNSTSCFKSFTSKPISVTDAHGNPLSLPETLATLKQDVELVTELAEWNIDSFLFQDLEALDKEKKFKANAAGRKLKISIPQEIKSSRRSGNSRLQELVSDYAVQLTRSWIDRVQVVEGSKDKKEYISAGRKRTADTSKPENIKPKMALSATDANYAQIINNPYIEGFIDLKMVIGGNWNIVTFPFDLERFSDSTKVTLPDVVVDNKGNVTFNFTVEYPYLYQNFNPDYIVAIDVGLSNYLTASVVKVSDGEIIETTQGSQRLRSIINKVRKANIQVARLQRKGKKHEAAYHRRANSQRKREMALIGAQEVVDLAYRYGNCIVAVEDLGWINNTMANGRWNHGELVKWLEHYVNLNGSRMFKVSAAMTSKKCHSCGNRLKFLTYHEVMCENSNCLDIGIIQDRDVNATSNIAQNFKGFNKAVATRKNTVQKMKNKGLDTGVGTQQRSPKVHNTLKYPGRDRTKNAPTPKRDKIKNKEVKVVVKNTCSNAGSAGTVTLEVCEKNTRRLNSQSSTKVNNSNIKEKSTDLEMTELIN